MSRPRSIYVVSMCRSSHQTCSIKKVFLKETRNSFKKWPLNLWWILNKTIIEVENITKAATFKSFLTHNYFFVTVLFNIFMKQTLTDDFWGLHKNMNCAFSLKTSQNVFKNAFFTEHLGTTASACDLFFISSLIFIIINHIILLKQTHLFFHVFWNISLSLLDDNVDEQSELVSDRKSSASWCCLGVIHIWRPLWGGWGVV